MPLFIDYREKLLLRLSPTSKEFAPDVGDVWIGDLSGIVLQAGGVILERKTGADLEASIMDGRYKEQRGRLLAYANQHKVAVGYVIEGILDRLDGRLSESALLKHITRMQFHHRIPVIQTASPQETLQIAKLIEEQWIKDKGQFSWNCSPSCAVNIEGSGTTPVAASYVKSVCRDSPDTFLIGTLTQCRGISEGLARLIVVQYPSIEELMAATAIELATITDPVNLKRKVGKAVAERLYGLLHKKSND